MNKNDETNSTDINKIKGHNYDGIEELDNPLPNWWLIIFLVSIGFGAIYFIHYQLGGGGLNSIQELEAKMKTIETQAKQIAGTETREVSPASDSAAGKAELDAFVKNPETLASGKKVFDTNCASCHGKSGEGAIGPNLTDNFWIHGNGDLEGMIKVASAGVLDKGMPGWGPVLGEEKVKAVSAYILSLKGTNPANAKAAQGIEIKN